MHRAQGLVLRVLKLPGWVLSPLSNSWIISIIWLYIALTMTLNIDCYWGGSTQGIEASRLYPPQRKMEAEMTMFSKGSSHSRALLGLPC